MAETTYLPSATILEASGQNTARFSVLVRITHWLNTVGFVALVDNSNPHIPSVRK